MLPSDILGVTVWQPHGSVFVFKPGPLFANIVLADEINRTTPKTQSSLLEAMNEAQVSIDHATYPLPRPFMVLATQNPHEYEGTYPLPESQLDRFLLRIRIGYPGTADEKAMLRGGAVVPEAVEPVLSEGEVVALQDETERVQVEESVLDYLMAVVAATRTSPLLALGVSPRGSRALLRAAQAAALADGRQYVVPDDVKRLCLPVLAHRVVPRSAAVDGDAAIGVIAQEIPVPR
jgi:MoxR-like ATPase